MMMMMMMMIMIMIMINDKFSHALACGCKPSSTLEVHHRRVLPYHSRGHRLPGVQEAMQTGQLARLERENADLRAQLEAAGQALAPAAGGVSAAGAAGHSRPPPDALSFDEHVARCVASWCWPCSCSRITACWWIVAMGSDPSADP